MIVTPLQVLLLTFMFASSVDSAAAADNVSIDRERREIRFTARVQPGAMQRPFGVKGHHAIVWKDGKSATWALFQADASDQEVRRALEKLGARAGENLTAETWTERENPKSAAPSARVEGARVSVHVEWKGSGG